MRMRFTFNVRFIDLASGMELPAPSVVQDFKLTDECLENYLDAEIADEGVVGGEVSLTQKERLPIVRVDYWHPESPSNRLIESVRAYTIAQLEDGIGEGGFEFDSCDKRLLIVANTNEPINVEVYEDGHIVLGPAKIVIAAREGDLERLAAEIKAEPRSIDKLHQGSTALHLAILYGHPNAVRLLLAAGANADEIDSQGMAPLEACALSNALDDEQSLEVGRMLLQAGGNPKHHAPNGETARNYAEARGKKLLATIL